MDRLSSPLVLLFAGLSASAAPTAARPEWQRHFDAHGVAGTFVLFEPAKDRYLASNEARGRQRFLPACTFEIANALIGLETGAIADENEAFRWDGSPKPRRGWERDHTLDSGMRESAVWMFQEVARRIGKAGMREWLQRLEYGNADIGGGIDLFWLQGSLRVSAYEQVRFLHKLAEGRLPATQRAQRLVRNAMMVEKMRGLALYAKAGASGHARDPVAWSVGWVERQGRPVAYFAMNLAPRPSGRCDALEIARAILAEAGALPCRSS